MTKLKLIYFLFPVFDALIALVLERLTLQTGPLLYDVAQDQPTIPYVFAILCSLSTILTAWVAIRHREFNPILRMVLINSSAVLVILDYFLFYDTTQLYCLCVLAVAYIMIWKSVSE